MVDLRVVLSFLLLMEDLHNHLVLLLLPLLPIHVGVGTGSGGGAEAEVGAGAGAGFPVAAGIFPVPVLIVNLLFFILI